MDAFVRLFRGVVVDMVHGLVRHGNGDGTENALGGFGDGFEVNAHVIDLDLHAAGGLADEGDFIADVQGAGPTLFWGLENHCRW